MINVFSTNIGGAKLHLVMHGISPLYWDVHYRSGSDQHLNGVSDQQLGVITSSAVKMAVTAGGLNETQTQQLVTAMISEAAQVPGITSNQLNVIKKSASQQLVMETIVQGSPITGSPTTSLPSTGSNHFCHGAVFQGHMQCSADDCDVLWGGESLVSVDCEYLLTLNAAGNLDVFKVDDRRRRALQATTSIWSTGTSISDLAHIPKFTFFMNEIESGLKIYEMKSRVDSEAEATFIWTVEVQPSDGTLSLTLTSEGILELADEEGTTLWTAGTSPTGSPTTSSPTTSPQRSPLRSSTTSERDDSPEMSTKSTKAPDTSPKSDDSPGLSTAEEIGISLGLIALLIIIFGVLWRYSDDQRRRQTQAVNQTDIELGLDESTEEEENLEADAQSLMENSEQIGTEGPPEDPVATIR